MSKQLIKAIDREIGEPIFDFVLLFPPAWIAAPFFLLFWIIDMAELANPASLERMLARATAGDAMMLRELIQGKGTKVRKFHLWKLREMLEQQPAQTAQRRLSVIASALKD